MVGTSNVRRCVIFGIVQLRERVGESATNAAIADAAPIGVHGLTEASEVSEDIIHSLFCDCGVIGEDIVRTDLAQYFLTTLSPHSARGRLKKHSTGIVTVELYNHVFEHEHERFHLLPSILSPHTSYPLIAMSRSCIKNCLTPMTFLLCIRRKLRLPIYPNRTPCTCGHRVLIALKAQ